MFTSDRNKIVNQIVIVSEKLNHDIRYDMEDAKQRLEQLNLLKEILKILEARDFTT